MTDADARRAGAADREPLLAALPGEGALHRIEFRMAGPDPRVALREIAPFKADVRKLKELGLTESLRIGYRLSPRGRAYYGYSGVARKRSRSRP